MTLSLARSSAAFIKFISPNHFGRALLHSGNRYCRNNAVRVNASCIFTRTFTVSPLRPSPQKNRYWAHLCASLLTGVCLQQVCSSSEESSGNQENVNFVGLPQSAASLSSGTYQAAYYNPIPPHIVQKMMGKSYKDSCPIPITDLAYVIVTHYDMNDQLRVGELVVHKKIAQMIMDIFLDIHAAKFPIEQLRLIDDYDADDDRSMEDNNSSGFCFRSITNRPGVISNHGLGIAVDINTRLNPYVNGDFVTPGNGRKYVDRSLNEPGMIHPDSAVVAAFKERGFSWGGDWTTRKDYQHFEYDRSQLGITV